jgi:FkbM family methyltransferase
MKVNYFDLGLGEVNPKHCWELDQILKFFIKENIDYNIYGIEASLYSSFIAKHKYKKNPNIKICNFAISNNEGQIKLYNTKTGINGASIYNSKNNVNKNRYEIIEGKKFSTFLKKEKIDLENSINIVKINIEGAEWDFFNDIVINNLVGKFDIFCGQGHDVHKIKDFVDNGIDKQYMKLLKTHNIVLHRFSEWKPERNINIYKLISDILISKK